jgi:hypothetical protein
MNPTSEESLENQQFKDTKLTDVHFSEKHDMNEVDDAEPTKYVVRLLETEAELKARMATTISFAKPILWHDEVGIIFPNTINVIQGQAGVHKSRLAETFCSVLLSKTKIQNDLGFNKNLLAYYHVLYVDTERNLNDQLPYSFQQIVIKAGYQIDAIPENFSCISLMNIKRKKRFKALKQYIEYLRSKTDKHLFIVLDVSSDCITDFNNTQDTMKLIDHMNVAVNNSNCTFLCVIHENPRSDKARGHLGTELMNKTTTQIQVEYLKQNNTVTALIAVNFLKNRKTKKPPSIFCMYSDTVNGLVLADGIETAELMDQKNQKSAVEDVAEALAVYFEGAEMEMTTNAELQQKLCKDFVGCNGDAMRKRLNTIVSKKMPILINAIPYKLVKERQGREMFFKIVLMESEDRC